MVLCQVMRVKVNPRCNVCTACRASTPAGALHVLRVAQLVLQRRAIRSRAHRHDASPTVS